MKTLEIRGLSASLLPFATCLFDDFLLPVTLPAIASVGHKSTGL